MGDYKMSCPGCDSWTNSVGLALRDDEPCPYCGLPADVTRLVLAAQERAADKALVERLLAAEKRAQDAERSVQSMHLLVAGLRGALAAYDARLAEQEGRTE